MSPVAALLLALAAAAPDPWRSPVALAPAPGGSGVLAACANGEVVRVERAGVTGAWPVARALTDLVPLGDGRLAATDPEAGEVLVLSGPDLEVVERHPVPGARSAAPVGPWLAVASRDAWTVTRVGGVVRVLELPFAPGELAAAPDGGLLVVADAFGGHLALVDAGSWELLSVRELSAVNVRGLLLRGDRLLLAHQVVDPLARASFDDLHWGNLVRNVVRELDLASLLDPDARLEAGSHLVLLGDVGRGAGDPSALLAGPGGEVLVVLAGTDELAVLGGPGRTAPRLPVGRRPVAASPVARGTGRVAVANALGGSVSFVALDGSDAETVPLGAGPPDTPAARGERLFFDARLSHDGWMSCHTCHAEGHSTGALADTLGDDTYDTPKRVPSLRGVGETAPYAWNGSQPTLEAQVEKSLRTTMHAEELDASAIPDLAAYLRSLEPPRPCPPDDPDAAGRGEALFRSAGCTECHAPPTFTSADVYGVGVSDERGSAHFNPPSLRGVGRRGRLLHDGRFGSLDELLMEAGHPRTEALTAPQRADLAAYLRSL